MKRQLADISNTEEVKTQRIIEPMEEIGVVVVDGEEFELNHEQKDAFNKTLKKIYTVEKEKFYLFISGAAGTGKTLLLKALRDKTEEKFGSDSCLVTAPISTAAEPLRARTIHSNFLLSIAEEFEDLSNERKAYLKKHFENRKVIFIDVINYVSSTLLARMDHRLQEILDNKLPFGGLSMIVFGDLLQLQPVGGPPIFRDIDLELRAIRDQKTPDSPEILWSLMKILELKTNERLDKDRFSSDSVVLESLRTTDDAGYVHYYLATLQCDIDLDFRTGLEEVIYEYNDLKKQNPNKKFAILVLTNSMVENINDEILENLCQVHEFPPVDHKNMKSIEEDYILEGKINDQNLKVAIGSQVMLTCNLPDQNLLHGMLGTVKGCNENIIAVDFPSGESRINRCDWYLKTGDNKFETWKQFPIRSAEAFTVDMAQGMTFDGVILVAKKKDKWANSYFDTNRPGHIYVALSRARSLELCRITPFRYFGYEIFESAMEELERMRNEEEMHGGQSDVVHQHMSKINYQDDRGISVGCWSNSCWK